MTATEEVLVERNKTHGDFAMNAHFSQEFKRLFQSAPCWVNLSPSHRESLDMIALKLSRILSGQANYRDHWVDICGYSKLAENACDKQD
jgi:hypothetical protein